MVMLAGEPPRPPPGHEPPLTFKSVCMAWAPFAIMSLLLLLSGIGRERENKGPMMLGPYLQSNYPLPLPWLHKNVERDPELQALKPEDAEFKFIWLTAPGSAVFVAALLSMLLYRMNRQQIGAVFHHTFRQMKMPIPTIALMLGLSSVTRYAGMDATLGVAFAHTGSAYPFFAPILGWLGVFLTGTDAGSNALFGSLQKITAGRIHSPTLFPHLSLEQTQTLICTSNSTGGVMGKMIDAQSIVVATAATNQLGREADIFKGVVWHSILLACVVAVLCLLQAYVWPFTAMVP
jgi:L-lactate permease